MKALVKKAQSAGVALALTMVSAAVFGQVKKDVTINGTLSGVSPMPEKIYVQYPEFLKLQPDSGVVKDGKYHILAASAGDIISVALKTKLKDDTDPNNATQILIKKGELNITSEGKLHNITLVTGPGATAQQEFNNMLKGSSERLAQLNKDVNSERYKTDAEFKAATTKTMYAMISERLYEMILYVRKNPTSPIAANVTYFLIGSRMVMPTMVDTLLNNLPAKGKATLVGRQIPVVIAQQKADNEKAAAEAAARRKASDEKTPVGSMATDFTQADVDGKPVSLSSFKGKYVLVDFWASWCMPCRAENPNVLKAYNEYKDKGFTVLGVSLDSKTGKEAWIKAIAKDGLTWTQVSDLKGFECDAAKAYGITAIPQNFLISPEGKIVAKNLRGEELGKTLANFIK